MGAPLTVGEARQHTVDNLYDVVNELSLVETRNQKFSFLTSDELIALHDAKVTLRRIRNRLEGR